MMTLDDTQGLFSSADRATLETETGRWPFEFHVRTLTAGSRPELVRAVHDGVTGPNVVCVGIDATHRYVEVHFGTAVGVQAGQFAEIAASGRSLFKSGHWREGVETIADRTAQVTAQAHATVLVPSVPAAPSHTSSHLWLLWILVPLVALGFYLWNRKRWAALEEEREELRARNEEEKDWHERMRASVPASAPASAPAQTPYRTSAPVGPRWPSRPWVGPTGYFATPAVYGPVPVSSPSSSDALLAYEIGRLEGEREQPVVRERVVSRVERVERVERSGDDDEGGAGASWSTSTDDPVDAGGTGDSFAGVADTVSGGDDNGGTGGDF